MKRIEVKLHLPAVAPLLDVMRGSIHHLVEQMLATKLPTP